MNRGVELGVEIPCVYNFYGRQAHIKKLQEIGDENPIKLIIGVLNYARKNKYPRKCSAFTYLDEEQPSRLDFGKDAKFGGPFTEEEVEDVKTVLRLVPFLMCD